MNVAPSTLKRALLKPSKFNFVQWPNEWVYEKTQITESSLKSAYNKWA